MLTQIALLLQHIATIICLAEYDIFQGFDVTNVYKNLNDSNKFGTSLKLAFIDDDNSEITTEIAKISSNLNNSFQNLPINITKVILKQPKKHKRNYAYNKLKCPEDELPVNIGPYEIPSKIDLLLHIKRLLIRSYNAYRNKAVFLLKDIKQINSTIAKIEKKCKGKSRITFKWCVKQVIDQCEHITKTLMPTVHKFKKEINNYTVNGEICNTSSIIDDPRILMKKLAIEKVGLDFKLPGFLRMLGGCTSYCHKEK